MAQPQQGERFVAVARILAPHGVRGELKVEPLTDEPQRLQELGACRLRWPDGRTEPAWGAGARPGPRGSVLLRLRDVVDRNQAERMRGAWVEVADQQLRPLPEGRYYLFEVIGLPVVDERGELLGHLQEVRRSPAHDIWVVALRRPAGKSLWLPAVREVVREVRPDLGRIVVRVPPGLEAQG